MLEMSESENPKSFAFADRQHAKQEVDFRTATRIAGILSGAE